MRHLDPSFHDFSMFESTRRHILRLIWTGWWRLWQSFPIFIFNVFVPKFSTDVSIIAFIQKDCEEWKSHPVVCPKTSQNLWTTPPKMGRFLRLNPQKHLDPKVRPLWRQRQGSRTCKGDAHKWKITLVHAENYRLISSVNSIPALKSNLIQRIINCCWWIRYSIPFFQR